MLYQVLVTVLPIITTPYVARTLGLTSNGIHSFTVVLKGYLFVFLLKTETERIELLNDFLERLSAEVANLHHILFGLVN